MSGRNIHVEEDFSDGSDESDDSESLPELEGSQWDIRPGDSEFLASLRTALCPPYNGLAVLLSRLNEFLRSEKTDEHHAILRSLTASSIQHSIADFLGTESLYDGEEYNWLVLKSLSLGYSALAELHFWIQERLQNFSVSSFDSLSKKIRIVHGVLWKYRDTVLLLDHPRAESRVENPEIDIYDLDEELEENVWSFIISCFEIFSEGRTGFFPREAMLMLIFIWCHAPQRIEECMLALDIYLDEQDDNAGEELFTMFKILTRRPEDAHTFLAACTRSLRQEAVIDQALEGVFLLMRWILSPSPDNVFLKREDSKPVDSEWARLLRGVLRSCERQLCIGAPEITEQANIVRTAIPIVGHFFSPPNDRFSLYKRASIYDHIDKLDVITFVARVTVAMASANHATYTDLICCILVGHSDIARSYRSQKRKRALQRLSSIGRRCIGPTLSALRRSFVPHNEQTRDNRRVLIKVWEQYQRALGLSDSDLLTTEDEASSIAWGACASAACLCSRRATHYHKMRVCAGCKRVLYCGPRCQKRDWEDRHRELCKRLRDTD